MGEFVAIAGLVLVCLVGVAMTVVRLPGTWLIFGAAVTQAWWSCWPQGCKATLLILGLIAVGAEIAETGMSYILTQKAGASRFAPWGGVVGGILGMFFLSIPVPIVGTIVGAIGGCFLGAAIVEMHARRRLGQSSRVGFFAAFGFVTGMMLKTALAAAMSGILLAFVLRGNH